jgi:hypothetical protein
MRITFWQCDICDKRDQVVIMNKEGHQLEIAPEGWFVARLHKRKMSAKADVCSLECASKWVLQSPTLYAKPAAK